MRFECTELEACSTKERAIADKILDLCKGKPIKRLDAAYWKKNRPKYRTESNFETAEDKAERRAELLGGKIAEHLATYGPATTSYLAAALHVGASSIRAACDLLGDQVTAQKSTNRGHSTTYWACRAAARVAKA